MNKFFYIDDSPLYKEKYLIKMNITKELFPNGTKGSYNVWPARLLHLSYGDYLRFCRDILHAEIIGKNHKYPIPFFDRSNELTQLVKLLNKRMEFILFQKDHPYNLTINENEIIKEEI